MASSLEYQTQENDQHSSSQKMCQFTQAWKSVKKHFPQSSTNHNADTGTTSIILHPLHNIDLIIEFCFNDRLSNENPEIIVKSETLSEVFVCELEKILEMKCTSTLIDWCTVGDELEKIMQCIEVKRKEKGMKKKKNQGRKLKSENQHSAVKNIRQEDDLSEEFSISVEAIPGLNFDWNSYSKQGEKKQRPNYFIAIRINDKNVISNISKLQNHLVSQEELLTKGVIPDKALHLTLCNLGLDTADNLLSAIESLNQMKSQLQKDLPKTPFVIHGASQFYNRAIYANVQINDEFNKFRNLLIKNLEKTGVEFREDHEIFTPHVTIIKVRRPERRAFGTRNIQSSIYSGYVDYIHGEQMVDAIYLCAMGGQKRDDGFYVTACELQFE